MRKIRLKTKGMKFMDNELLEVIHSDAFQEMGFSPCVELICKDETLGYLFVGDKEKRFAVSKSFLDSSGLSEEFYIECMDLEKKEIDISEDGLTFWYVEDRVEGVDNDDLIFLFKKYDVARGLRPYRKHSGFTFNCVESLKRLVSTDLGY